jgi:hypothetical protein
VAPLTVETEVNGDSKRTNARGPFLVSSLGLLCKYKYTIFLSCLGCSSRPSTKFSIPLSPSPSKLGRQPCWVACLLVCVSDGDKEIEIVYGEEKKILYWADYIEQPKQIKKKSHHKSNCHCRLSATRNGTTVDYKCPFSVSGNGK